MTDRSIGLIFIILMLVVSFAFQVQAKHLATELSGMIARLGGSAGDWLQTLVREGPWLRGMIVLTLAALAFVLWILALARLELSFALVFAAAGLAFNTIGSGLLLNEVITIGRIVGIGFVTAGLIITIVS